MAWLRQPGNADLIRGGLRGVEKESLRVEPSGRLSRLPHPRPLGSALTHPYLTTDYSEALLEFVTPPLPANWQTLQFLCDLHCYVHHHLQDELLWPASMPCVLNPEQEIPIAYYGKSNLGRMKTVYRRGLGHRYGRGMQAIAGVHFNFSPPAAFWPAYRAHSASAAELTDFKSAELMGAIRNYRRHAWLVTYLFGASPALCKSFRPEGHELLAELDRSTWYAPFATSLRMSDLGYRNTTQARLNIPANSLHEYLAALTSAVTTGDPRYETIGVEVDGEYRQLNANILQIENEYYSAIRPKPRKDQDLRPTLALRTRGVEYVEVRTLDLNIADPVGINQNQLRFLESLLIYCLLSESPPIGAAEQQEIDRRDLLVAREGRRPGLLLIDRGREVRLADSAAALLDEIAEVAAVLDGGEGYLASVEAQREPLRDPGATPSARLLEDLKRDRVAFFEYVLELARRHQEYFLALALAEDSERRFSAVAAASLRRAEELEATDAVPFGEYLRHYFESV
jgi:glutamate--cysteine ligase